MVGWFYIILLSKLYDYMDCAFGTGPKLYINV